MAIKGLKQIKSNLARELSKIEGDLSKGIRAAGIYVQGKAMDITPHDTGTLVNTAFNSFAVVNGNPTSRVGYTANYAPFVHEMPATYNYSKPGTGPKFLEKAVKNNTYQIVNIVRQRARF